MERQKRMDDLKEKQINAHAKGDVLARQRENRLAREQMAVAERHKVSVNNQAKSHALELSQRLNSLGDFSGARKALGSAFADEYPDTDFSKAPDSIVAQFGPMREEIEQFKNDPNMTPSMLNKKVLDMTLSIREKATRGDRIMVDKYADDFQKRYAPTPFSDTHQSAMFTIFGKDAGDITRQEARIADAWLKRSTLIKGLDSGMIQDLARREAGLERVESLISDMSVMGPDGKLVVKPELASKFGPVASRFNDFMRTWTDAPEDEKLYRRMREMMSELYGEAGKQLSDTELALARNAWLADPGQQPGNALAALDVMAGRMRGNLNSLRRNLDLAGRASSTDLSNVAKMLNQGLPTHLRQPIEGGSKNTTPPAKKAAMTKEQADAILDF